MNRGHLRRSLPEYCLLLAWQFADELVRKTADFRAKGGRCIIALLTGLSLLFRPTSRRPRRIVLYYLFPDFAKKTEAIAATLRNHGLPAEVRTGFSLYRRVQMKASPDLWIGFWNHIPLEFLPKNYIFFNGEPRIIWEQSPGWISAMRRATAVWDYYRPNIAYAASLGINSSYVPFGFSSYYETVFRKNMEGKTILQDIDVLFFGSLSPRRRAIIDSLRARGMTVRTVTRDNPSYGASLDELIARARIVLDVHFHSDPVAHTANLARLDYLLSNRIFVVTEGTADGTESSSFRRFVTTSAYGEIASRCAYYLERPAERARIAEAAYHWFKAEFNMESFLPFDDLRAILSNPDFPS